MTFEDAARVLGEGSRVLLEHLCPPRWLFGALLVATSSSSWQRRLLL